MNPVTWAAQHPWLLVALLLIGCIAGGVFAIALILWADSDESRPTTPQRAFDGILNTRGRA
jgi:F0F1-type ATP synthase assembly protein I